MGTALSGQPRGAPQNTTGRSSKTDYAQASTSLPPATCIRGHGSITSTAPSTTTARVIASPHAVLLVFVFASYLVRTAPCFSGSKPGDQRVALSQRAPVRLAASRPFHPRRLALRRS